MDGVFVLHNISLLLSLEPYAHWGILQLAVADAKLGGLIKDKLAIPCVADSSIFELMRCIRSQIENLVMSMCNYHLLRCSPQSVAAHGCEPTGHQKHAAWCRA